MSAQWNKHRCNTQIATGPRGVLIPQKVTNPFPLWLLSGRGLCLPVFKTLFFYHCGGLKKGKKSLSDCGILRKPPVTESEEKKTRRWRSRACFSGCYLLTLLQLPRRTAQTPAGLRRHQEKSQFWQQITRPGVCAAGKRHLVVVVKMLWHLRFPAVLHHSLHFALFTQYLWFIFSLSTHTLFSALWSRCSEVFLKRSSFVSTPPQSRLFSYE